MSEHDGDKRFDLWGEETRARAEGMWAEGKALDDGVGRERRTSVVMV